MPLTPLLPLPSASSCPSLRVDEIQETDEGFLVYRKENHQFHIQLLQEANELQNLPLHVINANGQLLLKKTLPYQNDGYYYELDMSYAPSGVYFIKLGKNTKKIIVP